MTAGGMGFFGMAGEQEHNRRQADARGVPAEIMMPRILLVVSVFLLVMLGLVMVFSASMVEAIDQGKSIFSFVGKQVVFALAGGVFAVVAYVIPYRTWLERPFYIAWGICMILLLLVPIIGTEILGAKRWIFIGSFSIQPTEFAKIALIMGAAKAMYQFSEGGMPFSKFLGALTLFTIAPLGFLFITQSDLGSALVITMGIMAILWLAEVPLKIIVIIVVAGLVVVAASMTVGYRAERMKVWLDPFSDPYGGGYQLTRSIYAFAEGGLLGVGLGNSREKFLYLPEAETDFIFSVIGEELGLVGAVAVLALFLVVLFAGLRIAAQAPDSYGMFLAGGLAVMLVGQAFLNIACATGLFPTTGKPLPFVSSGGSSMMASLMMVGLILSVSRGSNVLTSHEMRRNNLNVLRVERSDIAERPQPRTERRSSRNFEAVQARGTSRPEGARHRAEERMASRRSSSTGARRRGSDLNLGTGKDRSYYREGGPGRSSGRSGRGRR